MSSEKHKWSYFKSAKLVQVKIETGEDVAHLAELDQKSWTALAAPVAGLRFDKRTLEFLDSDCDGRIRAPEVLSAVEWLRPRLAGFDSLFTCAGKNVLPLSAIDRTKPEGAKLAEEFALIAEASGKGADGDVALSGVLAAEKAFAARPFNGDGVVTAESVADDPEAKRAFEAVLATAKVEDRSGKPGVDKTAADAFFKASAERLAWR